MDQCPAKTSGIVSRAPIPLWETGRITLSKDGEGRWAARTRYRDGEGRTRQLRRTGRTKSAAEAALKRAFKEMHELALLAAETTASASKLTVGEVAEEWLERRKPAPLPNRHDNPVLGVSQIPKPRKSPVALNYETVAAAHRAAALRDVEPGIGGPRPTSRLADVVTLLAGTGLRIGEVLAVRWADVDLQRSPAVLSVTGGLVEQGPLFFRSETKTDSSVRNIQLPDWVTAMLKRRLDSAHDASGPVFPTRNGTYMRPSNLRTNLRKALKAAEIHDRVTPHAFRSTVATLVAEGVNDEAAAAQLGHASPDVTRTYYIQRPDLVPDFSVLLKLLAPALSGSDNE